MSLLAKTEVMGLDPYTNEPFFWRGWMDAVRCMDGRHYHLRGSHECNFEGRPVASVCGRERAPFKLIPRYVDLSLYRTSDGGFVCHRKWVSEAHGEPPVFYDVIEAPTLDAMRDSLLNYDPAALAMTIWPEDSPDTARRAKRAKAWLRERYASRVDLLLAASRGADQ